jgi:2-oxoglutarate ferredoxin oxidoreductase subunit gamma
MSTNRVMIAGSGGQGIILMGKLLAYVAMEEGKEVTFLPSYGAEMRGGTANCSVIISDRPISCPVVYKADIVVVMNQPSFEKFESAVEPGGSLFLNSTLIKDPVTRTDIEIYKVDANKLAEDAGIGRSANIVMLGAIVRQTGIVKIENVTKALKKEFSGKKVVYLDANLLAFQAWKTG